MNGRSRREHLLVLALFAVSLLILPSYAEAINPVPNPELSSAPDRLDPVANSTWFETQNLVETGGFFIGQDNNIYIASNHYGSGTNIVSEIVKTELFACILTPPVFNGNRSAFQISLRTEICVHAHFYMHFGTFPFCSFFFVFFP